MIPCGPCNQCCNQGRSCPRRSEASRLLLRTFFGLRPFFLHAKRAQLLWLQWDMGPSHPHIAEVVHDLRAIERELGIKSAQTRKVTT